MNEQKIYTAEEARAMTEKGKEDTLAPYISKINQEIREETAKGNEKGWIWLPSGFNLKEELKDILVAEGYEVETHPTAIGFSW